VRLIRLGAREELITPYGDFATALNSEPIDTHWLVHVLLHLACAESVACMYAWIIH